MFIHKPFFKKGSTQKYCLSDGINFKLGFVDRVATKPIPESGNDLTRKGIVFH